MMKKLYEAVVVPKMLYAIEVWGTTMLQKETGKKEKGWNARGFAKKMESVQQVAATLITGGMRSSATDLLFAHTDLLPIPALIHKHIGRAALHLPTLPPSHPLRKELKSALRGRRRHKSPLHRIAEMYQFNPDDFETITPATISPKWTSKAWIQTIDDPTAAAQDAESERLDDVCIYSDGSGQNGNIGGAAILRRKGHTVKSIQMHLGKDTDHTVYEGEVIGLILAIELLKNTQRPQLVSLALDNQAAIRASVTSKPGPGQYLWNAFHTNLKNIMQIHGLDHVKI